MSHVTAFTKFFTYTCVVSIVLFLTSIFHDVLVNYSSESNRIVINIDKKYILLWTAQNCAPLDYLKTERLAFIENNCEHTNCYVTDKRDFFENIQFFDAIVFNGRSFYKLNKEELPVTRSPRQKYVFSILESSQNYPVRPKEFDDFFNWTWTYRLDSDVAWTYFNVYNNAGVTIAPSKTVNWIKASEEDIELSDELKDKLNRKTKAAAWFVSHCKTAAKRETFVADLRRYLSVYNLDVDIYGSCGNLKCPRNKDIECYEKLAKDYFFYLSFENSLVEDYVTEKVLTPLNHDSVPVVFGGANYTRFLPPGSYLNAMESTPKQLARTMNQIISDPKKLKYYNFFKWRKYYHFKDSKRAKVCDICALMNNWTKVNDRSSYKHFRNWWNR